MSLEFVVKLFAKKKKFELEKETSSSSTYKGKNREWMVYEVGNDAELILCGKSLGSKENDESTIYVAFSTDEQEMNVSVRYGCLRDYLNQLSTVKGKVLIDLKQRLESRLDEKKNANNWAEESLSGFSQATVYRLLNHFYP